MPVSSGARPTVEQMWFPHTLMPVRAVATTNLSLTWDGVSSFVIDGVTLNAGDRLLALAQTTTLDIGIYVLASGSYPRAYDMTFETQLLNGVMFSCREGTTYANKIFTVTFTSPATPGPYGVVGIDTMTLTAH